MSRVFVACFQVVGVIFFFTRKKWKVVHKRLIIDQNVITGGFSVLDIVQKIPQEKNYGRQSVTLILGTHAKDLGEFYRAHFVGSKFFIVFTHKNTPTHKQYRVPPFGLSV